MGRTDDDQHWHIDRRVPVVLVLTLLVQFGGAVWWARGAEERIAALERRVSEVSQDSRSASSSFSDLKDRVTRIEVVLNTVADTTIKIDRRLEGSGRGSPPGGAQ